VLDRFNSCILLVSSTARDSESGFNWGLITSKTGHQIALSATKGRLRDPDQPVAYGRYVLERIHPVPRDSCGF